MNNRYNKEENTFTPVTRSGLLIYDSSLLNEISKLEFFNLIADYYFEVKNEWLISKSNPKYEENRSVINQDENLASAKKVWQNSQEHHLYIAVCRVIQEIESLFDTVYKTADERYDEIMDYLCHFNNLYKENKRFEIDVNNVSTKC